MPLVDRPGTFKAKIFEWAVGVSKNNLPEMSIKFGITHYYYQGSWCDWSEHNQEITGYFYPFKNDGSYNDRTLDALKNVLGWGGMSLESLEHGDYAGKEVQIVVEEETGQNGSQRKVVKWLNPAERQHALKRANASELQDLSNKFDQLLRARHGTPSSAPAAKPQPPAKPPAQQQFGKDRPLPEQALTAEEVDKSVPF